MNNCWFRVKVGLCKPEEGGISLTFEHPTRPGNQTGGWMVKPPTQEATILSSAVKTSELKITNGRPIEMKEVRKNKKMESCWIVVHNKVYDCTKFMADHPGGADSILINGGSDATEEFDAIHSAKAQGMLLEYYIGDLVASKGGDHDVHSDEEESDTAVNNLTPSGRSIALNPKERQPFRLVEKEHLSHDVRRYRHDHT